MALVWYGGELIDGEDAHIYYNDRGYLLGDGLFETMRCQDGEIKCFNDHYERLSQGCQILGMTCPSFEDISRAVHSLLKARHMDHAVLRLSLTRGRSHRGLYPQQIYRPIMLVSANGGTFHASTCDVVISKSYRRDEMSPLSRVKTLNGLTSIAARREALLSGVDDALLTNMKGRIAEGTVSNLVAYMNNKLWTPPVEDGALPGIARKYLIEHGVIHVGELSVADLLKSEGVWLTNILSVKAVHHIDRHPIHIDDVVGRALTQTLKDLKP